MPCILVVALEDGPVQQPAHPLVSRGAHPRAQRSSDVVDCHLERRFFPERLGILGLGSLEGRPDPQGFHERVEPRRSRQRLRRLHALGRPLDEQRSHLLHQDVLGHHLLELVQDPPAARKKAQGYRLFDSLTVGFADLVEQARVVALPPQELAQEPEPALAVAVDERLAALGKEHPVHVV